jgi:hypothetical protein
MILVLAVDYGSVSSWFVVGSILVAAATFWATRRDLARAQASKVFAVGNRPSVEGIVEAATVTLTNASDGPIFDVFLSCHRGGAARRLGWRLHWRADSATLLTHPAWVPKPDEGKPGIRMGVNAAILAVVESGHSCVVDFEMLTGALSLPPLRRRSTFVYGMAPVVQFRDGGGRRWTRWYDGKLTRRI